MYNFFNRHYIFRQPDGEMLDIYCDNRQNLCSARLSAKNSLPDSTVIAKNIHPYFYAELDGSNVYHVVYQDNVGNINYVFMDGQWSRVIPVLSSKTPAAYNKQLCIAPVKSNIYLFYVLHHDNSFLLAYQTVAKGRAGTPKIVDYVSGSNIPCSIVYDQNDNIYAFYQSYDGKYLQLGYKKMDTVRRHWSDFTPVTKFLGNCEYPHAIIDSNGTIHLCYQRRTQKQYELVYQQKARDKNLWSGETVLHSSIYPFENSSVVQSNDKITVYWIRDDVIYYTAGQLSGGGWSRPARYAIQPGRQLQCICWKEQLGGREPDRYGSTAAAASPGIFPGTLSNGVKLAFLDTPVSKTGPQLSQLVPFGREGGSYAGDMTDKIMNSIKQLQENINELNTGWTGTKKELIRVTSSYADLSRELEKLSLRLNLLESKVKEISNPYKSAAVVAGGKAIGTGNGYPEGTASRSPDGINSRSPESTGIRNPDGINSPGLYDISSRSTEETKAPAISEKESVPGSHIPEKLRPATEDLRKPAEKPGLLLDPEARRIWEEWQEPKEWSEGS